MYTNACTGAHSTAVKCDDHGLWYRGIGIHIHNLRTADCRRGLIFITNDCMSRNALFVGRTASAGTPHLRTPGLARTYPAGGAADAAQSAYKMYNSGGHHVIAHSRVYDFISESESLLS